MRTVKREPSTTTTKATATHRVKREPQQSTRQQVPGESSSAQDTAPDRRVLRSKYLALHNKINDERDDLAKFDSDKFDHIIKEVDDLHKFVQRPREQVADAEALLGITSSLATSVKSFSNEGITVADFVSSLWSWFEQSNRRPDAEKDAPASINWKDVGLLVSSVFRNCSGFSTMLGPMNTELKQRKVAVRGKHARPAETARPQQVDDIGAEEKTDTDKNMAAMFDILRRKKHVKLEFLVLNRSSFAQTVENLFALSFLIKDGRVEITVDESGSHFVSPRNAPAASSVMSGEVTYRHFVFRFDFKDWKLMMDVVPDGEELMPNRETSTSHVGSAANHDQASQSRTPIRKLCRNRGLIVQEDKVVEDSAESDDIDTQGALHRWCKRRLS